MKIRENIRQKISVKFFKNSRKFQQRHLPIFLKNVLPRKCRQLNKIRVTEIAHASTKWKCGTRQITQQRQRRRIPVRRIRFRTNPSDITAAVFRKNYSKRAASDYSNVIKRPINIRRSTLASAHNQIHSFSHQFQNFPKYFNCIKADWIKFNLNLKKNQFQNFSKYFSV